MTNSPTFDQQLALNTYWETLGGSHFLPGTISAADRFVRTAHYLKLAPKDQAGKDEFLKCGLEMATPPSTSCSRRFARCQARRQAGDNPLTMHG